MSSSCKKDKGYSSIIVRENTIAMSMMTRKGRHLGMKGRGSD